MGVVAQLFVSLDGVAESPEDWHFPYLDEAMLESVELHLQKADVLLLGGATYDIFAASWPNRPRNTELSQRINAMPKVVVTSRLEELTWENSTTLSGELRAGVSQLADKSPVAIVGSIRLVRALLDLGLVETLQLMIHPIVLGSGRRLFGSSPDRIPMTLIQVDELSTGVIDARYARASQDTATIESP
jgi:dihydrofolate reductase